MKRQARTDLITGCVVIVCFLIYFSQTFSIRQTALVKLTSTFIPRLCVVFGIFLGAVIVFQAIQTLMRERKSAGDAAPDATDNQAPVENAAMATETVAEPVPDIEADEEAAKRADARAKTLAMVVAFVTLFVAIFLIEHVGFVWGTAFYLIATFIECLCMIKKQIPK